ncbi:hypothetical protein HCB26_10270 [Listeria booriae]|uniref:Uncharacterized protein n=1 Tax=Listeria booriae TaxID=1552123 RepID=A0A7X0WT83_9LIST|nr:hypothetical protein [Listeria booriae]MBC1359426.1 hypothetical protein [Listeria booriae]MBC2166949.1 hypothetical protein [Listeria booriae]MBC2180951.1 hypothetical protein [Listeria booriae]MBC2190603.1 hypothetical protein [Listeria booriae]
MYSSSYNKPQKVESYDYYAKQEQRRLQSKLDDTDANLTASQRADIIASQRALEKEMQMQRLKEIVPQKINRIISEHKEYAERGHRYLGEAYAEIQTITKRLDDALDSKTGAAVQEWLGNMQYRELEHLRLLREDAEKSIRLD